MNIFSFIETVNNIVLQVLKMVSTGVLVDKIVGHSNPPKELVNITHDLKQYACEMKEITR